MGRREKEVEHVKYSKLEKVILWILRYVFFGWTVAFLIRKHKERQDIKKYGAVINDDYILDNSFIKKSGNGRKGPKFFLYTELNGMFEKQEINYGKYKFFQAMGVATSKGHLTARRAEERGYRQHSKH